MNEEQLEKMNREQEKMEEELSSEERIKEGIELMEVALFGLALGFVLVLVLVYYVETVK